MVSLASSLNQGFSTGLQVLAALPQEMQLVPQTQDKDHMQPNMAQVSILLKKLIVMEGILQEDFKGLVAIKRNS